MAVVTLITYQRQIVAIAGAHRFYLAPAIGDLPDGDPLKTFVCFLALYARDVQTGELPGDPAAVPATFAIERRAGDRPRRLAAEIIRVPRSRLRHANPSLSRRLRRKSDPDSAETEEVPGRR